MAYYDASRRSRRRLGSRRFWLVLTIVLLVLAIGATATWIGAFRGEQSNKPKGNTQTPALTPQSKNQPQPPQRAAVPTIDLQPVIDAWTAKQSATYSIVVYDPAAKKVIGSNRPDEQLFAASLYKLYVAYLALEDIQNGKQDPNEIIQGSHTRRQCIDLMIRESHSPCGEAMMADMGPAKLEARVKAMGITHTTFNGIKTSASDSVRILQYIVEKQGLNAENTAFLRDAMRTQDQKYKNGLAKGAPAAIVDSKVGWNETINYHDVGIFTLPDKSEFIVAVLSQGNGSSRPIADFSATIYAALIQ